MVRGRPRPPISWRRWGDRQAGLSNPLVTLTDVLCKRYGQVGGTDPAHTDRKEAGPDCREPAGLSTGPGGPGL